MKNLFLIFSIVLFSLTCFAQDKTTGGVKGKVRLTNGDSISGVLVQAQQDEKEVAHARTDKNGDFVMVGLKPGVYDFIFNKDGLAQGTLTKVDIKAGNMVKLTKLTMAVDQGSLAIIRGSVFDANGRSVFGARVEIAKVSGDSTKKISEIYSSESGEFVFRLPSQAAQYRISAVADGKYRGSKEINVNGAQVYQVAVSLKPGN